MKKILTILLTLFMSAQIFAVDLNALHTILIKFYGYQRAGLKTGSCYNLNPGFASASHGGDSFDGNPLDGGWYDAGDYIKFGMNLSYSVYSLLVGYDAFPDAYEDKYGWDHSAGADKIPDILNQVKFATDFMIKAVISDEIVILDVGSAASEHGTWGVVNAGGRSGTKCDGADIPATYAACLGLMSNVYRKFDAAYADKCLEKAKIAFSFAKKRIASKKEFCTSQTKDGKALYGYVNAADMQISDRMVAAGVELSIATNDADPTYKSWAQQSIVDVYNTAGYSYIGPLASYRFWRGGFGGAATLMSNVNFVESKIQTSGKFSGVYRNSDWGTARDVGIAAFEYALAYVVSSTEAARTKYLQRAKDHVDWVAGANGQSYIVGFNNGPKDVHYRPTYSGPQGGVVSGPNDKGEWMDGHQNYQFTEVAIDYNAGIVGAVAFLKAIANPGEAIKVSKSFEAAPNTNVDLRTGSVKFSATFSKSIPWNILITGNFGSKTLKGTGTSINETWDGTADNGFFLGGELARARLIVEGIAAYDLLKVSPVTISISNTKKAPPKNNDKLIDDFEDSDTINKVGGRWIANGTGTGLKATKISVEENEGSKALLISVNNPLAGPETYSGVRATFNSTGAKGSIGASKSVIFDLQGSQAANVSVELEQSTVTDGAYHSVVIPVTDANNSYRLEFANFKQPDWKTSEKPLDLNSITALRFTVYDSVGRIKLYLDNVAIEDFSTDTKAQMSKNVSSSFKPVFSNNVLVYNVPQTASGSFKIAIYNVAGKQVMNRVINTKTAQTSVSLSALPHGIYTIVHSANGNVLGESMKITHVK